MPLRFARVVTPIGPIILYLRGEAVCGLAFEDRSAALRKSLSRRFGGEQVEEESGPFGVVTRLRNYFDGDLTALDPIEVDPGGSAFQHRVWMTVRLVPPGSTISYSSLAEAVGRPAGERAAGLANARNPVAIIVPCHRVVGIDGELRGYAGGLERKRWLLRHEGVDVEALSGQGFPGSGDLPLL